MKRSLRLMLSRLDQSRLSAAWRGREIPIDRSVEPGHSVIGLSQDGAPQVRPWQRVVAASVAVTLWLAPLQVTWRNATQSAAQLAVSEEQQQTRNAAVDWQFFAGQLKQSVLQAQQSGNWTPLQAQLEQQLPGITRVLLTKVEAALPSVQFGPRAAFAGPITDPAAPIRFQPQITSSSGPGGNVPVVNITRPNANGISLNQYSSFNVDAVGLILNNSLAAGGSLLGGSVAANPLLGGRTATQIINQVTSQGSPSNIFGSIEVFGAPASVIVVNPNGVNCTSCGFVNAPHITLTTGTPQFLSGPGGSVTSFDNAAALSYNVQGGRIQIEGAPGASGTPGAGIEGTVGAIDLIAGSIGINAPLYAGQQINLVSGQQVVAQAQPGQGRAGSDYQVSSNGANTAASNTSALNALQIDASAFGAMTAGQIKVIGTSQGLGVRNDGTLTSSIGALSIDANGDVRIGTTYGKTSVDIASGGNVSANGDSLGEQSLSIAANGNLQVNGSMQSHQNVTLQAGGNISGSGGAVADNSISATAGNSINLGGKVQAGNTLNLTAQGHDGTGDITLGGSVTAPNQTAINAARDITIDGSITSATTLALAATRNLTINGTAGAVGDLSLQGRQGSVTTAGNVVSSSGNVNVLASTDANLGGQVYAAQSAQLQSQNGNINVGGNLAAQQQVNAIAANNITLGGSTQSGGNTSVTASNGSVAMNGDLTSGGTTIVHAGQNISGTGKLTTQTDATLDAGQGIAIAGALQAGGNLTATAGQNLALAALTVGGNNGGSAKLQGLNVTLAGPTSIGNASGGNLTVSASNDATLGGQTQTTGQLQVTAGRDINVNGSTLSNKATTLDASRNLTIGGNVSALGSTSLTAQSGALTTTGNVQAMAGLSATSGDNLTLDGQVYSAQDVQLQSQHGSINVGGTLAAQQQLSATAANSVILGGNTQSGAGTSITATAGSVAMNGSLTSGGMAQVNAGQNITGTGALTAQTDTNLTAGQAIAIAGSLQTGGVLNAKAGQNLSLAALTAGGNAGGSATLQGANVTLSGPTTVGNASGGDLTVTASNDATLGGQTQTTGQLQVNAGRDINVNGSTLSNGATILNASRNLAIGGSVNALGNTSLTAQTGSLSTTGNVLGMSDVSATSGSDLTLGGQVYAAHSAQLQSQHGSINVGGALAAQQQLSAVAANSVTLGGSTQSGANTNITATSGSVAMNANLTSGGTVQVNAGQNITGTGTLVAQTDTTLTAGQAVAIAGALQSGGNLTATAGQNLSLAALTVGGNAGGSANLQGANVQLSGPTVVGNASGGNLTVIASNDATLGGQTQTTGNLQVNAGRDISVNGGTLSNGTTTLAATRNLGVGGTVIALGDASLAAQNGSLTTTGSVLAMSGLNATSGGDLNVGGQVYAQNAAVLQSQHGNLSVSGDINAQNSLQASAAGSTSLGGTTQVGGNATIAASGGNVSLGGNLTGHGAGTITAGSNITGTGNTQFTNNANLSAGNNVALAGSVGVGGNLNAVAGNSLALGATTVLGAATLAATQGNLNLNGATTTGGNLQANAGADLVAAGAVNSLQSISIGAGRNLTTQSTIGASSNLTASAGQALALNGVTTSLGNATLSGASISTGGDLNVGGTLQAGAQNGLNLTGGLLTVGKDANLSGSDIALGGAASATSITATNPHPVNAIGGNLTATAGNSITTGNVGVVKGNASLNGANSFTNNGNWLAAGGISVTTQQAVNSAGAALQSLGTTTVNATNLNNAGTIFGVTTNINASNSIVNNNGVLLARDNLNVVTGNFTANQGGLLFAGDTSASAATTPASGNVSLTVNGGAGSFNNTGGQILAANNVKLALPNQSIDPTAATFGTVNLNGTLTLIAQSINVNGNWNLPGSGLNLQASSAFTNNGTIQKSGDISISGASFTNNGNVIAGNDVTLNGVVTNQAGAVIHADHDVNLGGTVTNAGKVEAVHDVNLSGASYDNTGGTTTANHNVNATLSGVLANVGSSITAANNVNITAASVNNDRAAPVFLQNTTTTVIDPALLGKAVVGIQQIQSGGGCTGESTCPPVTYTPQNVTLDQLLPDYATGILTAVKATEFYGESDTNGSLQSGAVWHFGGNNSIPPGTPGAAFLNLPTVQTVTQSQANGQQGLITAGNQTSITANSLSNRGSTISGNNVVLNVQSLNNGRSDTITTSKAITSVDQAGLNNLIAQIAALGVTALGPPIPNQCLNPSEGSCSGTLEPTIVTAVAQGTSVAPTVGGTTTALGVRGQIVANQDVQISGGNLVNTGNIVAGRDVTFNVASLTNQGESSYNVLTQGSLVVANPAGPFSTSDNFNPLFQSVTITQDPATIVAGRNLAITAGSVSNNNSNLAALGNVSITSPGTVSNQSGTIQASSGDVTINAAQLNNVRSGGTVSLQSRQTTFAGQTVADLNQDFFGVTEQAETSQAGVINGARNVSINSATLNNTGSLINAGQNASITVTSALNNNANVLAVTSYHSHVESDCSFGSCDHVRENDPVNNNTPNQSNSIIQAAGSLNVNGQGGQYAALQNTGAISGYQVNLTGSSITNGFTNPQVMTPAGSTPKNVIPLGPVGIPAAAANSQNGANQAAGAGGATAQVNANPNVGPQGAIPATSAKGSNGNGATSTAAVGSQTASATAGSGATSTAPVGGHTASTVAGNGSVSTATIGGQGFATAPTATVGSGNFHFTAGTPAGQSTLPTQSSSNAPQYVVTNPASNVLGGLTPQVLLNSLPPALQPNGSVPFYFDPFTENQQLQQAALAQTGNASFVGGVQWDSKNQVSLADQQKAVLYSNAINYATQNNVQLGQALSQQQINELNAPMLWYVEQTVPDPNCKATGSFQCGTINALMPQVYLPQATQGAIAGGVIQGNQVTLTATGSGDADHPNGTVTNTGFISAQQLIINAQQLNNEARNADIGVQTYRTDKQGYTKVTGDEVQPGGFLSAANYQLNVDRVNSISGQFQQVNANGTVNQAGSQVLLDGLKQQLGGDFTQSTATNHIQQEWVQTKKADPTTTIVIIAAAIALSIVTAGTAGVALAGAIGATGVTGTAVAAAVGAMASSAFTQLATTGSLDLGTTFEAGAIGGITAGLTQGITYDSGSLGMTNSLTDPNSLANLGGAQSVGNGLTGSTVTQAGTSTATTLGTRIGAVVADSAISAGVQTIIGGGSFGNAFKNSLIGAAAAAGAYAIGNVATDSTSMIAQGSPGYVMAHALLGCASASLGGNSCAAGAVGGATSALIAPQLINLMQSGDIASQFNGLTTMQTAAVTALSVLVGGGAAAALGLNATVAASAAQNEALNNSILHSTEWAKLRQQCVGSTAGGCALVQKFSNSQAVTDGMPTKGVWQIVANVNASGVPIGYSAYNTVSHDVDFVMNPQDLSTFMSSNTPAQFMASGAQYLGGLTPQYQQQAGSGATNLALGVVNFDSNQIKQGLSDLAAGWGGALKDPGWWLMAATAVTGGVLAGNGKIAAVGDTAGANTSGTSTVISSEMEIKILSGQQATNASGNPTNRIIGGHSGEISNDNPNYAVQVLSVNADGTQNVKFVTQLPSGDVSNVKTSTLFPSDWANTQTMSAVRQVADTAPLATRASDGASLYQGTVNGVKVEVIKVGNNVTAAYPCGKGCTDPKGF